MNMLKPISIGNRTMKPAYEQKWNYYHEVLLAWMIPEGAVIHQDFGCWI